MTTEVSDNLVYTSAGWLTKFRDELRRSLPAQVDTSWAIQRLKLSEANARQFLGVLQRLGWITEEGGVTEKAKRLRLTGDVYTSSMGEIAREVYPRLLSAAESDHSFDLERLRQYITSTTVLGESARGQIVTAFRWFVHEAGMSELEDRIWGLAPTRRAGTPARPRPGRAAGGGRAEGARRTALPQPHGSRARPPAAALRPQISLVVNLNISPESTPEQVRAIVAELVRLGGVNDGGD